MKRLLLLLIGVLSFTQIYSQGVVISENAANLDGSAMLDIQATDKGLLIPRVNIANLAAEAPVTSPATSLLVYNTNGTTGPGFFYWNGSKWESVGAKFMNYNQGEGDYTLNDYDYIYTVTGSTNFTITLPLIAGRIGRVFIVKSLSTVDITVETSGSEVIDVSGITTYVLSTGKYVKLISNGVAWIIIGQN